MISSSGCVEIMNKSASSHVSLLRDDENRRGIDR
jgi:hypothetical protein